MAKTRNSNRPKQPLSSYNLFYRYKRQKLIEAGRRKVIIKQDDVRQLLVATPAGAEFSHLIGLAKASTEILNEVRQYNIRQAMEHQLQPNSTAKRVHRKSHGFKISFRDMNKMMLDGWKEADELTKAVFRELREKGRKQYDDKKEEEKKSTSQNDTFIKKLKRKDAQPYYGAYSLPE